jgi:hypothetical protein
MDREERSDVDICRKIRVSMDMVTIRFAQGTCSRDIPCGCLCCVEGTLGRFENAASC